MNERVARIEAQLAATLPTLLTKGEFREAMHAQTWKLVGAAIAVAGLIVAGIKLIP